MRLFRIIVVVLLPVSFIVGGWMRIPKESEEEVQNDSTEVVSEEVNESEVLINYLEAHGDFINTPNLQVTASVNAEEVFKHIGDKKYHIIDLREEVDYYPAHIPGSVHVEATDLYQYMKSIPLKIIDKVVLVCYAGQKASYNTGLLRLAGYENVFYMKYGMSAWSKNVAEGNWLKNLSNEYASGLTEPNTSLPESSELPTLYTMQTKGNEILTSRIIDLMQEDYSYVKIKADELMANASDYFIIQFDPLFTNSNVNGINGSYFYTPGQSFKLSSELQTIPSADYIILTSSDGHTSAMATAYLRALGYDARFLAYGLSAVAKDELKNKGISVFSTTDVKAYNTAMKKAPVRSAKPLKPAGGC